MFLQNYDYWFIHYFATIQHNTCR